MDWQALSYECYHARSLPRMSQSNDGACVACGPPSHYIHTELINMQTGRGGLQQNPSFNPRFLPLTFCLSSFPFFFSSVTILNDVFCRYSF